VSGMAEAVTVQTRTPAAPGAVTAVSRDKRAARREWRLLLTGLTLTDSITLMAAFSLAYWVRFGSNLLPFQEETQAPGHYLGLIPWMIPLWLAAFAVSGLYNRRYLLGGTEEYDRVVNACTLGAMGVVLVGFLDPDFFVARGWLILFWLFGIFVTGLGRFTLRRVVYVLRRRGHFTARALIVGTDDEARAIAHQFNAAPTCGVQVVGFVGDRLPPGSQVIEGGHVLATLDGLEAVVSQHQVDELIVSATALTRERLLDIFRRFGNAPELQVRFSSGLFEIFTTSVQVKEIGYVPLMSLSKIRLSSIEVVMKTVLDYGLAIPGVIVLSPFLMLIAVAVKLDSPGPIFHRRRVLGVGGKPFYAYKFRTMHVQVDPKVAECPEIREQFTRGIKPQNDPRVTRVGGFLRRYSLDEFPQLFNVLKGQMSLVGPRMITPEEQELYGKWDMNLLTVKPGITGLWQISGRNDLSYEEKVRLDMHYIRNYTIWLDLRLLFQTFPAVLSGRGAY
jgi:exopolysaccharide biosynthesis polyprenyl glycosylphosphotransferase